MPSIIEVRNEAVDAAAARLRVRLGDLTPVLAALGEDQVERIKGRFATATGPDGRPWAPNTQATLIAYLEKRGGFSAKTGKITAKGQKLAIAKRPLQGETGDLARQIFYQATNTQLFIGSTMIYAAMQHFGGKKSEFPKLWGDIPARPFFPITAAGTLYPADAERMADRLRQYLDVDGAQTKV